MTSKSLHSIYAAFDNHNYARAIKLCLANQDSHPSDVLSRALLAHAYAKAGQRYKALITLASIFGPDAFPELQLAIQYCSEHHETSNNNAQTSTQPQQLQTPTATGTASNIKKSKKGKKKPAVVATTSSAVPSTIFKEHQQPLDWIDRLDTVPTLPTNWEELVPTNTLIPDSTLITTMAMTLSQVLHLPLTVYQLYAWAATTNTTEPDDKVLYFRKAITNGIAILLHARYASIVGKVLSNVQVLCLQLARLHTPYPATLWAAQTALWQIQYGIPDDLDPKRAMLPRLAESLASKCVQMYCLPSDPNTGAGVGGVSGLAEESFLLYMQTLDLQNKWEEKLEGIQHLLAVEEEETTHSEHVIPNKHSPPRQMVLEMKIETLQKLNRDAREIAHCLEELLQSFPDDWEYWKQYFQTNIELAHGDILQGCCATDEFVDTILEQKTSTTKYPLRGPHLLRVEMMSTKYQNGVASAEDLIDQILEYGEMFAPRASCTFSDLAPYLEVCLDTIDHAQKLLVWCERAKKEEPSNAHENERRNELRKYIFVAQVNMKIIAMLPHLRNHLFPWRGLVNVWNSFQSYEEEIKTSQAQKESRPADELILLAVQSLLSNNPGKKEKMVAAVLLETAMQSSPYNSSLKISAIFVYADLFAVKKCWELFNELHVKNIQYESCVYLILPLLRMGGCYREIITICQEILGLQRSAIKETADFAGRAMERGTISKAKEFIEFYRNKMGRSLTTLEAKGLILDCAPLLISDESNGEVGVTYGITGGSCDLERTRQMVEEAHNPYGAFSLLRLDESLRANSFPENRDFGILSYQILSVPEFHTPEQILRESLRRGLQHDLLIRTALCVDSARGPKKGKISRATPDCEKRCKSLLKAVGSAASLLNDKLQPQGYIYFLSASTKLCISITILTSGMNVNGEIVYNSTEEREEAAAASILNAYEALKLACGEINIRNDLSVSKGCSILTDCIVHVFALFRMCSKVADLFGWGPRKQKTKRCAGMLTDFSANLVAVIDDIKFCFNDLPGRLVPSEKQVVEQLDSFVDPSMVKETINIVRDAQQQADLRVVPILNHLIDCLDDKIVSS